MFIFDKWDEHEYLQILRKSLDMRKSRRDNGDRVGGDGVANEILRGAYLGLFKRELVEDDDPRDHLPSETGMRLLNMAFSDPNWPELRRVCGHERFNAAMASAAILDTITTIVQQEQKDERQAQRQRQGTPKGGRPKIDTLDKIEQAQEARDQAEHDTEALEILDELEEFAQSAREKQAIEAKRRKHTAHKEMSEKKAEAAEAEGRAALERVERAVKREIGEKLRETTQQVKAVSESIERLVDAGVLEDDADDMLDEGEFDDYGDDEGDDDWEDMFGRDDLAHLSDADREELGRMTPEQIKATKAMSDALKSTAGLAKLAEEIGRIKAVFRSSMKPTPIAGNPGSVEGVTYGNRLADMTSATLAQMINPRLRKAWKVGFVEETLPLREMWGPDLAGRGPIVLAVDASSSMHGSKYFWAKALAIALLSVAREQERDFAWLSFSHKLEQRIVIPKGKADIGTLVAIEQHGANGNTDYAPWMRASVEIIESNRAFTKADVIVITDGEPNTKPLTKEVIEQRVADHRRARAHWVTQKWTTQEEIEQECEQIRQQNDVWTWWDEQRQRLGFRVRGVYIGESATKPAVSMASLEFAEREEAKYRVRDDYGRATWSQGRVDQAVAYQQAIKAEIAAGMEVVAPVTNEQIVRTVEYHQQRVLALTTDRNEDRVARNAHNERLRWLSEMQSPTQIMEVTCDTWSDVSQITDRAQTEAVEAELARMVE